MTQCVYCNRAAKEVIDTDQTKYCHCDNCHEDFVTAEQQAYNRIIWENKNELSSRSN